MALVVFIVFILVGLSAAVAKEVDDDTAGIITFGALALFIIAVFAMLHYLDKRRKK